jgi:hypothetical protein
MPSGFDTITAEANAAFRQAADPKHITIVGEMARALVSFFICIMLTDLLI